MRAGVLGSAHDAAVDQAAGADASRDTASPRQGELLSTHRGDLAPDAPHRPRVGRTKPPVAYQLAGQQVGRALSQPGEPGFEPSRRKRDSDEFRVEPLRCRLATPCGYHRQRHCQ